MINLRLKAKFERSVAPFVVRLVDAELKGTAVSPIEALVKKGQNGQLNCESQHGRFHFSLLGDDQYDGDIVLCIPEKQSLERLIRANSKNNTLLFTERCDQLCVMCSQPPREVDSSWRIPLYEKAILLADTGSMIGISGGEPTLYKQELFELLMNVGAERPDICFHILSNGQHFAIEDRETLKSIHAQSTVIWGIPLYAKDLSTHDLIVAKNGAFSKVMENLFLLASTDATIELRTVVTGLNALDLPELAAFVAKHLPFLSSWAIMATEPIGFAKANRHRVFFDHSVAPQSLHNALDICRIADIPVKLFNFPRCTVGEAYRHYCAKSISDWKNKYIEECDACTEKDLCCGFFEWYNPEWEWANISAIRGSA